jgi:hypothetical protein
LQEWHALQENDQVKIQLQNHINILEKILQKYIFIHEHFYPDMVIEHKESEATFKCIEEKLLNIKNQMNTIIENQNTINKLNIFVMCLAICMTTRTSHLNELHHMSFTEITSLSQDMDEIMEKLYGKARSFENDIARKCWILCGAQNEESIPKARFFQAFAHLVSYNYKYDFLQNKNNFINAITMFIDRIDGCFGDPPDNEISRLEVMHLMNDLPNSLSLIELLSLDNVINQNDNSTSIHNDINLPNLNITDYIINKLITVTYKDPIKIPVLSNKHYGEKWPSKSVCKIELPFNTSKIRIKFTALDQGWGGTGHCSVRYQLNDNEPQLMYFIQSGKYINDEYVYDILKRTEKQTQLTLYLCCAPWAGWEAHISNIRINFIEN